MDLLFIFTGDRFNDTYSADVGDAIPEGAAATTAGADEGASAPVGACAEIFIAEYSIEQHNKWQKITILNSVPFVFV